MGVFIFVRQRLLGTFALGDIAHGSALILSAFKLNVIDRHFGLEEASIFRLVVSFK